MLPSSVLQQIPLDTSQETEQENLPLSLHAALKSLFSPRQEAESRSRTSKNPTCKDKIEQNRVLTSWSYATETQAKGFSLHNSKNRLNVQLWLKHFQPPPFLPERQPPGRPSQSEMGQWESRILYAWCQSNGCKAWRSTDWVITFGRLQQTDTLKTAFCTRVTVHRAWCVSSLWLSAYLGGYWRKCSERRSTNTVWSSL